MKRDTNDNTEGTGTRLLCSRERPGSRMDALLAKLRAEVVSRLSCVCMCGMRRLVCNDYGVSVINFMTPFPCVCVLSLKSATLCAGVITRVVSVSVCNTGSTSRRMASIVVWGLLESRTI